MQQQGFAPNETMQLHELLTLKNLSLTKLVMMSPLVTDDELKTILKNNIKVTQQHVKELKGYLEQVVSPASKGEL